MSFLTAARSIGGRLFKLPDKSTEPLQYCYDKSKGMRAPKTAVQIRLMTSSNSIFLS